MLKSDYARIATPAGKWLASLFNIVEDEMNVEITIKALRCRGGLIVWSYDNKKDASRLWRSLTASGQAPDTGGTLETAMWFEGDLRKKSWARPGLPLADHTIKMLNDLQ